MAIKGGYNRKGLPKDKDGLPGKQKGNLPMTRKPRRRLQRHGLRHNPSFL